jgi:NADH dehydrogenase
MKIIITGATGYIGSRVVELAIRHGFEVVSMSRRSVRSDLAWIRYDFTDETIADLPSDTTAVIHLAADTSSTTDLGDSAELDSARLLISATRKAGSKLIFVSSQTAKLNAPTEYGRTKWRIEQEVLAAGGWVIRPGQVYGGTERGLFGTLVGIVRRLPVLPSFLPAPKVQPIHVDDLATGLLRVVQPGNIPQGVLCLASPKPMSFTKFLSAIANHRVHALRFFVPMPIALVKLIGFLLGSRLKSRLGVERLISLFELPMMETAHDLKRLNLTLRPLAAGMHRSGDTRRRRLIKEAHALAAYILKEDASLGILRRYLRVVEQVRDGAPLNLPTWALRRPVMLALFDHRAIALSKEGAEFVWRLDAATALVETTPQGARRFLGIGRDSGMLINALGIAGAIAGEVVWRVLRIAYAPFLKRALINSGINE